MVPLIESSQHPAEPQELVGLQAAIVEWTSESTNRVESRIVFDAIFEYI